MQCTEDDVARFGGTDGRLDRFQVSHFTNQDTVGILSESATYSLGETGDVDSYFALIDR